MHEVELFLVFTRPLDALRIPYMVKGSVASILYGEPRLTHDIDLVIELRRSHLESFCTAFPFQDFYCPPSEILLDELARTSRGHFNLIHHDSGFKGDVYLLGQDPLHRWGLDHRRTIDLDGETIEVAPPEYVMIRKLEYFQEGGSEKHLRDIEGILDMQMPYLDLSFMKQMVVERGLDGVWKRVAPQGE